MEIRQVRREDDRLAISRVYAASWREAYREILPPAYLDSIPEGRWVHTVDDPEKHTLILLEGGEIVGVSSYCASRFESRAGWGEIVSLYLLPDFWGRGCGAQLLRAAVEGLRQLGYRDIFLWVLEGNVRARRFYERSGFQDGHTALDAEIGGVALREVQYLYRTGQ